MIVRTVLGDIDPATLGPTYIHEHLILDNALIESEMPHIHLPSVEEAVAELEPCVEAGVRGMVDAMPAAGGRHPARLAEISRRTGISIVATTGLHTPKYYAHHPWANTAEPEVLAQLFIDDIETGIDRHDYTGPVVERTDHRAGLIKVATAQPELDDRALRLFSAAAIAHARTGAPILTHCEGGIGAMEQLAEFTNLGVPLDRVVISHMDKVTDLSYHRDVLDTGAYVGYDQALRQQPDTPGGTVDLVVAAAEAGSLGQVMLGTDGARRTLWAALGGGPGLAWMRTGLVPALLARGLSDDDVRAVFETNPQRFLSIPGAV